MAHRAIDAVALLSALQQAGGQWRPSGLFRPFSRITGDRVLGRQLHCFPVREERAFPVRIIARLLHHVVAARNEQRQEEQRSHRTTSSRSEEHTSELQSLMRISYAVFCLNK